MLLSVPRRRSFATPQVRENYLIGALVVLTLVAVLAPAMPASAWHIPHFVDTRSWLGVPNAGDVLSNFLFLAMAVWGLVRLRGRNDPPVGARWFFVGLILTCVGSVLLSSGSRRAAATCGRSPRHGGCVCLGFLGIATGERISVRAGPGRGCAGGGCGPARGLGGT